MINSLFTLREPQSAPKPFLHLRPQASYKIHWNFAWVSKLTCRRAIQPKKLHPHGNLYVKCKLALVNDYVDNSGVLKGLCEIGKRNPTCMLQDRYKKRGIFKSSLLQGTEVNQLRGAASDLRETPKV